MKYNFIVIGTGSVFEKYWLPLQKKENINILQAYSIQKERDLNRIEYKKINQAEDVSKDIIKKGYNNFIIAILTPSNNRRLYINSLLKNLKGKNYKIFIEKPYFRNLEEVSYYKKLIKTFSKHFYFSNKYCNSRANILFPNLPRNQIPTEIRGFLIEGSDYFNKIINSNSNTYLEDGPELDLGFHLVDIITKAYYNKNFQDSIKINLAEDLLLRNKKFLKNFGFYSELKYKYKNSEIKISLQAGKADTENKRGIIFKYKNFAIYQEYTYGSNMDPVFKVTKGKRSILSTHSKDYNYYENEITNIDNQTLEEQERLINVNRICIEMKNIRNRNRYTN